VPRLNLAALRETQPWEYLVRFAFGGVVTACTGVIAHRYGPSIGGLFLAFPAILPASLTLLKRHDGRRDAAEAAAGARLGAAALTVFAGVEIALAERGALVSLAIATLAWAMTATALWVYFYGWPRIGAKRADAHRSAA
jgi:hypothetical protein